MADMNNAEVKIPRAPKRAPKKKVCQFCVEHIDEIDYEFAVGMSDYRKVGIGAVSHLGLDLYLQLSVFLIVVHILFYLKSISNLPGRIIVSSITFPSPECSTTFTGVSGRLVRATNIFVSSSSCLAGLTVKSPL